MKIIALDIGGANTKIAVLDGHRIYRNSIYFPFWKRKNEFDKFLFEPFKKIKKEDIVAVTMTAELSDAYKTKAEGVRHILGCVGDVTDSRVYVLSNNGELLSIKGAKRDPYSVASANWIASAIYIAKNFKTGILIDTGSTTTDIIPFKNGKIIAKGRNDTERLQNDELLYTGALRTNISEILNSVPVNGKKTKTASEFFANTADVYRVLGNITEKQYTCETADNRGKSKKECMARLARIVCADMNTLSGNEIMEIADYTKEKQIMQISDSIKKISRKYKIRNAIITGTGKFLAFEAAKRAGIAEITESDIDPTLALAFMINDNLKSLKSQSRI